MWTKGWRDRIWSILDSHWDIIVIGGGITGAGILREAARVGLRALLIEAHDFASGTSSHSSKLVHGGFRYLRNGQLTLTYESVREREYLLKDGKGLVNKLGFLMPSYNTDKIPIWLMGLGLAVYSVLALRWDHRRYNSTEFQKLCPLLNTDGLHGGYRFFDAQADDARLVLRVIQEAVVDGGVALNYASVSGLLRDDHNNVSGVIITDKAPAGDGRSMEIKSSVVINATGAWADEIRAHINQPRRLRKLRGSHLILPYHRLPLTRAISIFNIQDGRPVFAFPWEGIIIVGTTDVDHQATMNSDISITQAEVEYLLQAIQITFPGQELSIDDIQATFSGVRPVVDTRKTDPSKESREHIIWNEYGLVTVTGGKLTTFRLMALQALKVALSCIPDCPKIHSKQPILNPLPVSEVKQTDLPLPLRLRLLGRYGENIAAMISAAQTNELTLIDHSTALWAELRWAARSEGVVHLDDLLLRRVRLGLLLPHGGINKLEKIRSIVQEELDWDDARWEKECTEYVTLWHQYHQFNN